MLIREMRSEDKPRERFQESPKMASMTDLVAILLRTGRQGYSVMQLKRNLDCCLISFIAFVNVKNRLLGYKEVSIGGLNETPVDIKEAMKWAIRYKAYGLILLHNHPSGYPEPSKEDIEMTKTFAKAAKLLDMVVLDHVIIGDGIYVSLHERGVI